MLIDNQALILKTLPLCESAQSLNIIVTEDNHPVKKIGLGSRQFDQKSSQAEDILEFALTAYADKKTETTLSNRKAGEILHQTRKRVMPTKR